RTLNCWKWHPWGGELSAEMWPHLQHAAVAHVEGHIEDDREADIGDPAVLFQEARDEVGGEPHQRDGEGQAEYQNHRMLARRARDGEHVVERHRDVSDRDLPYGLAQRLLMARSGRRIDRARGRKTLQFRLMMRHLQLAPHLPAYPKQENAAGEQQPDDLQQ